MKTKYALLLLLILPALLLAGKAGTRNRLPGSISSLDFRGWRLSQTTNSYYDDDENLIPDMRFNFFYGSDTSTLIDSLYMDIWDVEDGMWLTAYQRAYTTHKPNGRIADLTLFLDIEANGEFIPLIQMQFEYNAQNRITSAKGNFAGFVFEEDEDWITVNATYFIYGAGTSFSMVSYNLFDDPDERYSKTEFDFDSNGRIIADYSYISPDSLTWTHESKSTVTYHPQDNHTGADLIEFFSSTMPMMMIFDSMEYPGMMESVVEEYWTGDMFTLGNKTEFEYNDALKLVQSDDYFYSGGNWLPYERELYFYGDNGQVSHRIQQNFDGGQYENHKRDDYIWQTYTSANEDLVNPIPSLKLQVYPSPFADRIQISTLSEVKAPLKVAVYNLKGQLIRTLSDSKGSPISWDGKDSHGRECPSGLYLIRAYQNGMYGQSKAIRRK